MPHTPAPWKVQRVASKLFIESKGGNSVAFVSRGYENAEDNAQLIASAPELLRAAKNVIGALSDDGPAFDFALGQLREAIATAEGSK